MFSQILPRIGTASPFEYSFSTRHPARTKRQRGRRKISRFEVELDSVKRLLETLYFLPTLHVYSTFCHPFRIFLALEPSSSRAPRAASTSIPNEFQSLLVRFDAVAKNSPPVLLTHPWFPYVHKISPNLFKANLFIFNRIL